VLYTDYVFLFQAAGLILLVAMIGAIVLTLRDRKTSRHQNIASRPRGVADTLEMVEVRRRRRREGAGHLPAEGKPEPAGTRSREHGCAAAER
jgi:NADH-quinone oxidoreductase subunit J